MDSIPYLSAMDPRVSTGTESGTGECVAATLHVNDVHALGTNHIWKIFAI